jgi:hypothetical protein
VGKGINAIALLWDATVELPEDKKWSYNSTMVYVLSHYKKASANLLNSENPKLPVTSILGYRNKQIKVGQAVFIAERLSRTRWKIHEVIQLQAADDLAGALPLDHIWGKMTGYWSKSTANKFDVFISRSCQIDSYQGLGVDMRREPRQ